MTANNKSTTNQSSLLLVALLSLVIGFGLAQAVAFYGVGEEVEVEEVEIDTLIELTIDDRWWTTYTHKTELVSREEWSDRLNAFDVLTMRLPRETREQSGFFGESVVFPEDFSLTGLDDAVWANSYAVTYFASLVDADGTVYFDEIESGREGAYWSQASVERVVCRQLAIETEVRDCVVE